MSVRSIEAEVSIKSGVQAECTIGREVIVEVHDDINLESLEVTANGNYTPTEGVDGFFDVTVQVPERIPVTESLTVTENGTYEPTEGIDGYDRVVVDVPPTIPDIEPLTVTEDGTYQSSGDGYNPVTVNTGVGELRQEIAGAKTASGCDPLVDGLTALTTYANEVTGQEDETLSDAVETLASKYGKAEFNICKYLADCTGLFQEAVLPEEVELDFSGNTAFRTFKYGFLRASGVKHIIIKNLVSNKNGIGFDSFLNALSDAIDLTFDNCDFAPSTFESLGRSCNNLEAIYGELDCSKITGGNGLSFWGSPKFREFRIKPNTINFGKAQANFGAFELSDETIISIANGLNPLVTDQSLYLANVNKAKLSTILGNNDNGTFIADENGSMTLMDFITTVKGWTVT